MIRTINSIVRTTARFLVFLFTGLAFLSALVIVLSQVDSVRRWGLSKALVALNDVLLARVEVGSISGNFITGISLHDVRLVADSTTLLTAPLIDVRYQLRPIFKEKVIGASVVVHNPVIRLIRNKRDSVWNFARITKPTPIGKDSASVTPFPYTIDVHGFEIKNGTLSMHDLTQEAVFDTVARSVNYSYLDFKNFNASAQAHIEPDEQSMWLQNVSFYMPRADVRVIELTGHFALDTTGATIEGLRLETDRTLLDLSARLDSANFFAKRIKGPDEWKHYPVKVDLDAKKISTLELKRFIPALAFLDGSPRLKLAVEGTYGNIGIEQLQLGLTHSRIGITGRLRNLDHPDSLHIEARIANSKVTYADVPLYVPGLDIPDLRYLGTVDLRSAEFIGYPQVFNASIDASTAIGSARGAAWMDVRRELIHYAANVAVAHANLAPIMKDKDFESDFTGHLVADGSGFTVPSLNTSFRLVSESSRIAGRSYRKLIAAGSMHDNGFTMVDTLLAAWGPQGSPNAQAMLANAPKNVEQFRRNMPKQILNGRVRLTEADRALFASVPSLKAGGRIDFRNRKMPRYNVVAQGHRFALGDVIPGASSTRITFSMTGSGVSFDPDEIQGEAFLNVSDAELSGGRRFTPFTANVALTKQSATDRTFTLRSDLADIDLSGRWDFKTVVNGVVEGINGIVEYLGRKAQYREEDPFALGNRPFGEPVNATYKLDIKNLAPLEVFLDGAQIAAEGELHGEVSGTSQLFNITAMGELRNFMYKEDSLELRLLATQIQVEMRQIVPGRIDDITSVVASIRTDSIAQYNDIVFNAPRFEASLNEGKFRVSGATGINDQFSLAVNGEINTTDPEGYRVMLDTVRVGLPNGVQWRNVGTVRALIGEGLVSIDSLAMRRNNAEVIEVRGRIAGSNLENVEIVASQGYISNFATFLEGSDSYSTLDQAGGWLRQLRLRVNGTLQDPTIEGTIAIDSLSYSGNFIGNVMATVNYQDQNLKGDVKLDDKLIPLGTAEEAEAEIQSSITQINGLVNVLNTSLELVPRVDASKSRGYLQTVIDTGGAQGRLAQLATLQEQLTALSALRAEDTLRWRRTASYRGRLRGLINQLRPLVIAETGRATLDTVNLTAHVAIRALPVDLALASREERLLSGRPVDIEARTDSLPIAFVAPFLSGVRIKGGTANLAFTISGTFPNPVYSGEGTINQARAVIEGNNILYYANAKLRFSDETLSIEEMVVRNDPRDLRDGRARITGTIKFEGLSLGEIRLTAETERLLVLSDATQAVNETVYGDLVIASGTRPLRFTGRIDQPRLSGDVTIITGNLRMERGQGSSSLTPTTQANYVDLKEWLRRVEGDNEYGPPVPRELEERLARTDSLRAVDSVVPGSLEENFARVQERIGKVRATRVVAERSLADIIRLDLSVRINGRLFLTIDFSPIEQLRAELASDANEILVRRGDDGKLNIIGSVQALSGSKYIFIKTFDASGALNFSGDIQKAKLGIRAEHNGRRLRADNSGLQEYQVIISITGTLDQPQISLTYTIDGQPPAAPDQDTRNRNAISLLLFARTTDELAGSTLRSQVGDLSSSLFGSGTSSIASRILTDILAGGSEFIRSIDVDLSGRPTNVGQAKLNVVSQFGRVIVRFGGQISDPTSNGTVTIDLPLAVLLDVNVLRDLVLQLEAAAQTNDVASSGFDNESQVYRVRVQYRKLW